tara:strand:+ start:207 stop:752 length:546 start_codon:yes stop_codon:yes gene_type:complete
MDIEKLRFPIGKYLPNKRPDSKTIKRWIRVIDEFPISLIELTKDLSIEQLNWKYRPDGWKVKQVIHHCADSHMNAFIRFKLAITETKPIIKPYFEADWAELIDSLDDDIENSINILVSLHKKWVTLINSLNKDQLLMTFTHPEHGETFNLNETVGNYAWHSNHHLEHIRLGIKFKGKFNNK